MCNPAKVHSKRTQRPFQRSPIRCQRTSGWWRRPAALLTCPTPLQQLAIKLLQLLCLQPLDLFITLPLCVRTGSSSMAGAGATSHDQNCRYSAAGSITARIHYVLCQASRLVIMSERTVGGSESLVSPFAKRLASEATTPPREPAKDSTCAVQHPPARGACVKKGHVAHIHTSNRGKPRLQFALGAPPASRLYEAAT
jgi:hypothetical protein